MDKNMLEEDDALEKEALRVLIAGQHYMPEEPFQQGFAGVDARMPVGMTFIQQTIWWKQYEAGKEAVAISKARLAKVEPVLPMF